MNNSNEPIYSEDQNRTEVARQLRARAKDFTKRGLSHQANDVTRLALHVESGGLIDPQNESSAKYALNHRGEKATQ